METATLKCWLEQGEEFYRPLINVPHLDDYPGVVQEALDWLRPRLAKFGDLHQQRSLDDILHMVRCKVASLIGIKQTREYYRSLLA